MPVNCDPSTAGNPTPSNTTTLPFDVPVFATAAVPSAKLPLAELASAKSDKLLAARKFPTFARFTIFASDTFFVVAVPLLSTIGTTSVDEGVPEKAGRLDIFLLAIINYLRVNI
jgi:hypothetical protein